MFSPQRNLLNLTKRLGFRELSDFGFSALCVDFQAPLEIRKAAPLEILKPGHVRVQVNTAAVNFADILQCRGKYQEKLNPPFIPGLEFSGEVVEVSSTVSSNKIVIGDKIIGFTNGGAFSSFCEVSENSCIVLPRGVSLDMQEAAALMVSYGTAYMALTSSAKLKPGEVVLVTAAGGGVGLAACELASCLGGIVIAAAGSEEKIKLAHSKGAQKVGVICNNQSGKLFRNNVKAAIDLIPPSVFPHKKGGIDVFIDNVGGEYLEAGVRSLNWGGRAVVVGFAGGVIPSIPANILLLKNTAISGLYWGATREMHPELFSTSNNNVVNLWRQGHIKPHISNKVSLANINEAFRLVSSRESTGKVVVVMP